jgi:hypothetical protein
VLQRLPVAVDKTGNVASDCFHMAILFHAAVPRQIYMLQIITRRRGLHGR